MTTIYDVIIIGGGPTGSTAATLLSRMGHKVLLLEKENFPREHVGESLIPSSYASLENLGVIEELKKISPRKPGVQFVDSGGKGQSLWCFKNVVKDKSYLSFHVKRSDFDALLLNNSRKNGAEVMEATAVKNVSFKDESRLVEVESMSKEGKRTSFTSRFLIDASGQSTFLGSKLGVKKSFKDLDRVALFSHWSGSEYDSLLKEGVIKIVYLGGEKKGWSWVIPISPDNLSIGIVMNNAYMKQEKEKFLSEGKTEWKKEIYLQELKNSAALSEIINKGTICHNVQVIGDYSYHCEKKYGDNYAIIGDAGAFLDPIFSSGIFVGMRSAELVAAAINDILKKNNRTLLEEAYKKINGAVQVLEKFIRLFYLREVDFSKMGDPTKQIGFESTENLYSLFHFLLAGDFFEEHSKYSDFLDTMLNDKMIEKFRHLIRYNEEKNDIVSCNEKHEEMYGEMNHQIVFSMEELN
jgi:flavin-dependent dehydrogenase